MSILRKRQKEALAAETKRADERTDELAKIYQDVIELAWDVMCYVPAEARGVEGDGEDATD